MENQTDEQLAALARDGNAGAFEILLGRSLKRIYGFVYRLLDGSPDTEDVTQEAWIKAWKNLKQFNPERSFKAWIFGIAKHAAIDYLRKKRAIPFSVFEDSEGGNAMLDTLEDPAPLPSELLEQADAAAALLAVLQELPLSQREVVVLYYEYGLNFREIAEAVNEPLDTIKSRHRRALLTLKQLLTG